MARQYVSIADNKQHYDTTAALSSPGPCATNLLTIVVSGPRSGSHCSRAGTLDTGHWTLHYIRRSVCCVRAGPSPQQNWSPQQQHCFSDQDLAAEKRGERQPCILADWWPGCSRAGGLLALASCTHRVTFHLFWQHRNSQQPLIGVQRQI